MKPLSVGRRLLGGSLVIALIVMPLTGLGLAWSFRDAVTTAFDQRLLSLSKVLIAAIQFDREKGRPGLTRSLGDLRFDQAYSGWYWQISDRNGNVLTSRSLWDQRLPPLEDMDKGVIISRDLKGPRHQVLRSLERDIRLPGRNQPLHVMVAASRSEVDAEVARFEWLLAGALVALASLLVCGSAAQISWGLAPLRRLRARLKKVADGEAERLEETRLPPELTELTRAINAVLERDQRLIERGRAAAGNLAHALKTPVSVLKAQSERFDGEDRARIDAELKRIDEAVRHHLARASAAGGAHLSGRISLREAAGPVFEGLGRLASRRGITLSLALEDDASVRVDPQDLQEMVGNLLENALQWARQQVRVSSETRDGGVLLIIEDDGPGMNEEEGAAALGRGARLDEGRSGSGLGLAIVDDLMALYGGELALERSSLGGLAARVWLPSSPLVGAQPKE